MPVSLRLDRKGKRRRPYYHLVAIDGRKKQGGMYLAHLGTYDPLGGSALHLDLPTIATWLARHGAQPSDRVRKLLHRASSEAAGRGELTLPQLLQRAATPPQGPQAVEAAS